MGTPERLRSYYQFDADVLEAVSEVAARQNEQTFTDLSEEFDIDNNLVTFVPVGSDKPLEVLTLQPQGDYDETQATVYHTPMGNPITPNMVMRSMRLFASDPTKQLIVVGNPSAPGAAAGKVSLKDARTAHGEKSLRVFTEPFIRQLGAQGIKTADHVGFSYGADKAATASHVTAEHGIRSQAGVYIEPTSVQHQSIINLAKRFGTSGAALKQYIEQSASRPYAESRSSESMLGMVGFGIGLLRASNLAIVSTLAHGGLERRIRGGLDSQPDMRAVIGWGTSSELADDQLLTDMVTRLSDDYGDDRIGSPLRMQGMHHAGENDIDLHAAIVRQGLKR